MACVCVFVSVRELTSCVNLSPCCWMGRRRRRRRRRRRSQGNNMCGYKKGERPIDQTPIIIKPKAAAAKGIHSPALSQIQGPCVANLMRFNANSPPALPRPLRLLSFNYVVMFVCIMTSLPVVYHHRTVTHSHTIAAIGNPSFPLASFLPSWLKQAKKYINLIL